MFRCYRQIEHSDCGISCIRMISRYYGVKVPRQYLHSISDLNRVGMSIKDMKSCFEKIEMKAEALQLRLEHMDTMPLPAILFWQQRHFVVLYRYDKRKHKFYIADPAQGKMTYSEKEFRKYWMPNGKDTGLVILAEPTDAFIHKTYPKEHSLRDFFSYIYGFFKLHKVKFLIALLLTLGIMAADFAAPVLLKRTIDDGIGLKNLNLVLLLLLGQLSIAAGGLIASSGMNLILTNVGLRIHLDMVNTFLEKLSSFPLSFFDKKVSSDFVQKINDHSRIKSFLLDFPNSLVIMIITIIVFSCLLFHYSKLIFMVFILMSVLEVGWNALFLNKQKTLDYAYFTNIAENQNHAYELTNGMADLKVNNAEKNRIVKWKETQKAINEVSIKSARLKASRGGGQTIISRIKDLMVTGVGAALVISGDLTLGILISLGYITGRLSLSFSTMGSLMSTLQDALLSYQRIDDVINDNQELRGNKRFSEPSIIMKNISFKYAGASSPFVINNFNLIIEKGKVTALVGESGCGKSTLIKLMLGFYLPQKGELILSGHKVEDIDNQNWLRHCGVVMQEARIFSGSILENVSLSEESPEIGRVLNLLEIVGLKGFIESLPMGVYTNLGVAGIEMSGGQKQRLMIARALYKDPDLLFLDEATSSLDANNEKSIVANISNLSKGKTIVIAAHRLSTVQDADKIVFVKDGTIAEMGTHSELVRLKGYYWKLVKNQLQLSE